MTSTGEREVTDVDKTHCVDCGCELSKDEIEDGVTYCYGCVTWYLDYAALEAKEEEP